VAAEDQGDEGLEGGRVLSDLSRETLKAVGAGRSFFHPTMGIGEVVEVLKGSPRLPNTRARSDYSKDPLVPDAAAKADKLALKGSDVIKVLAQVQGITHAIAAQWAAAREQLGRYMDGDASESAKLTRGAMDDVAPLVVAQNALCARVALAAITGGSRTGFLDVFKTITRDPELPTLITDEVMQPVVAAAESASQLKRLLSVTGKAKDAAPKRGRGGGSFFRARGAPWRGRGSTPRVEQPQQQYGYRDHSEYQQDQPPRSAPMGQSRGRGRGQGRGQRR